MSMAPFEKHVFIKERFSKIRFFEKVFQIQFFKMLKKKSKTFFESFFLSFPFFFVSNVFSKTVSKKNVFF